MTVIPPEVLQRVSEAAVTSGFVQRTLGPAVPNSTEQAESQTRKRRGVLLLNCGQRSGTDIVNPGAGTLTAVDPLRASTQVIQLNDVCPVRPHTMRRSVNFITTSPFPLTECRELLRERFIGYDILLPNRKENKTSPVHSDIMSGGRCVGVTGDSLDIPMPVMQDSPVEAIRLMRAAALSPACGVKLWLHQLPGESRSGDDDDTVATAMMIDGVGGCPAHTVPLHDLTSTYDSL
ncbi:hypothetical protein GBF38_005724 [Nibea albiflora]|uniref:Uncharacterized protein n=1 Tax=Nibea albiflora TaxID=240163 RepID=A0ACB7F981_NIBAL|nr:hypothetical protein GBF38_005724 [Nibea albiflora]